MLKVVIKYFTEKEMSCRCGCGKLNYSHDFLIRLTAFRIMMAIIFTVTCGNRCWKHNKDPKVGGEPTSRHLCEDSKGNPIEASAADISTSNLKDTFNKACASGLFNEVIWYTAKNFIHLGCDPNQKGNWHKIV